MIDEKNDPELISLRKVKPSGVILLRRNLLVILVGSKTKRNRAPHLSTVVILFKAAPAKAGDKQYEAEKTETGEVSLTVYLYYIVNMGFLLFGGCTLFFTVSQFFSAA